MIDKARLYWRCRRGMRELDIMLKDFLDLRYETLNENERAALDALLGNPDPLLLEWLMGRIVPFDREVKRIVEAIRNAAAP